jgi:cytochrome P450
MTTTESSIDHPAVELNLSDILAGGTSEPCSYFDRTDSWRDRGRLHPGDGSGTRFWLFTEMDDMRAAYQMPDVFSNSAIQCDTPNPEYLQIPEMLDGREHGAWRRLMGPLFSPGSISAMESHIRERFDEILDQVAPRGHCDFVADVALRFPNTIFLELMGMPVEDADRFQEWETAILHEGSLSGPEASAARDAVFGYFDELIADRRANPGDDIVSKAISWQIDGRPVTHEELLSYCLLLFMAGLDTVASQMSYAFYHLATHPTDRERIVADPSLVPIANEELLRYYSIVAPGRKVMKDVEVAGCPMKAGDMALLPLASANRDPKQFERADEVVIDRAVNPHIAFGAGPHRCIGSHLARLELKVAMEAWHARIPEYELDLAVPIGEHSAGLIGLNNLPLRWRV